MSLQTNQKLAIKHETWSLPQVFLQIHYIFLEQVHQLKFIPCGISEARTSEERLFTAVVTGTPGSPHWANLALKILQLLSDDITPNLSGPAERYTTTKKYRHCAPRLHTAHPKLASCIPPLTVWLVRLRDKCECQLGTVITLMAMGLQETWNLYQETHDCS